MMTCKITAQWAEKWDFRDSPCHMSRKFHFSTYRETSAFLDYLNVLIKQYDAHPHNINFATKYATIAIEGDADGFGDAFIKLAEKITAFADSNVVETI